MDEVDALLLTAVGENDVVSLQTHLSSLSDPSVYLNRVYDKSNEYKCTLPMIASVNGHTDIMYMLLNSFKFDLEVLNVIQINDENEKSSETYQDVTILWAAAAINNFDIVKLLVENGARINHTTSTSSTSLRCACFNGNIDMVRYLIENGADVHINNNNNGSNLALSVYRKHLELTTYLVDELGCDVNECDNDHRSPLYFAVRCGSLEIVQFLLNHGARNFPETYYCISPLMLAAEEKAHELMAAIIPYCSILEQIEAEELLGSSFACAEHGPCDLQQCFHHYKRALELRSIHNLPKGLRETTSEIFNHRQECQTIDELEELRLNSDDMYIEALLIRERLLGPTSVKYLYSLIYRGAVLADDVQLHQAVGLWLYELQLRQQHAIAIDHKRLRLFTSLFTEMVHLSLNIPIDVVLLIMTVTVGEIKHNTQELDYHLHTLLVLITIISQSSIEEQISVTDRRVIYRLIYSINQVPYITREHGSSLLHLSVNNSTTSSDNFIDMICKYPCLSTIRTLFRCGANVNSMDAKGNTPLHILASNSTDCNETILQLLCDAGAHLDYTNTLSKTPIDIAFNSRVKRLLQEKKKINLKCLCAQLIRKCDIPFHEKINTSLVNFVERH